MQTTGSTARVLAALVFSTAAIAAHAQTAGTLDKIKETGAITVSYRESSVPFSYLDENSKPIGFAFDLCKNIVAAVEKNIGKRLTVNLQAVTSANRIPLLQNGTIDIECGSTTNNSERQKQVSFAINHYYTGTRFLVKSASGIKSLADLKGKTVVSTSGTTNFKLMNQLNEQQQLGMRIVASKDHAEGALLVELGRADAFAMDDILLYGLKANSARASELAVVGEALQVEPYAIMVRKDDAAFKKAVDDALIAMMKSGEFETLYKRWFQSSIPPKGIHLNVPMAKELSDNIKQPSDKAAM